MIDFMKKASVALACISIVSACAPQQRFEWGSYERDLYRYYQNAGDRENYKNALIRAIDRGEETNRVAPGLYAELGFLHWEQGDLAEAQQYFEREMELFPESRVFISSYIDASAPNQNPEQDRELEIGETS